MRELFKCVVMVYGGTSVATGGIIERLKWCAISWDMSLIVSIIIIILFTQDVLFIRNYSHLPIFCVTMYHLL